MMKWMISLLLALFFCVPAFVTSEKNVAAEGKSIRQPASVLLRTVTAPVIIDRPVRLTEYRKQLTREYAFQHYGEEFTEIVPQAVVVHLRRGIYGNCSPGSRRALDGVAGGGWSV